MNIKVEIANANELAKAMQKAPDTVQRNMRLAMRTSLKEVQTKARQGHRFKTKSGDLERDVRTELLRDWPPEGRVFLAAEVTRVTEGKWAGTSYGLFVHEGTKPHDIFPRKKKWLRWAVGDRFVFAKHVKHPGTKPDQFIYEAGLKSRAQINAIFDRYAERAVREAGL